MKRFEIFFGIVKIPSDFLMTVLAFFAAYQLRLITDSVEGIAKAVDYTALPTINEYLAFSFGAAISLILIFALGKMYSLKSTTTLGQELRKSVTLCGVWAMAIITYFFFTRTFPFSRLAILYSWSLTFLFIIFGRALIKVIQNYFLKKGVGRRKLVFIGNNRITEELYEELKTSLSYKIIGIIGNKSKNTKLKILGSMKQLSYILKKRKIDEVIQTSAVHSEAEDEEILEFCELNHINYRFVPNLVEMKQANIMVDTIKGIPIINLKPTPLDGWGKVIKRILDIVGALIGFIALSPIILITTIAIKLDSKGPILFSRLDDGSPAKRIGQKGRPFRFYKFRSMHPNTDSLRYTKLAHKNTRQDGPLVKIENDPRVTKVGKFIRRYSIDELPQLWNVLVGNMSLVGPRPHLPEEVANYQNHHQFVLTIKPGLTGIAQISGRSDLSFDDEVKLDRYYIENWSIWRDTRIILRTISVVLKGHQD
jgi:exopolysaccharide biosynthesis polyprenyl glycosylphosphotransferase